MKIDKNDKIQSVLFSKEHYTRRTANKWIKDNNFINKKVDITKNWYRYRQFTPKPNYKYRMKKINKGKIMFVLKIN